MANYWIIIHDRESYNLEPKKIGRNKESLRSDKIFPTIRKEDRIIYYAKNKEAIGIFRVASEGHFSVEKCWNKKAGEHFIYDIEPIYLTPVGVPTTLEAREYGINNLRRTATKLSFDQFKKIKSRVIGMEDPESEGGVVCLFSKLHQLLGFPYLKSVSAPFPDCIAVNEKGKETKIEFEKNSADFVSHKHPAKGCDLIVCWKDTLGKTSPVEVLELRDFIYSH